VFNSTSKRGRWKKRAATEANPEATTVPPSATQRTIPDLNEKVQYIIVEEVPLSQNAPNLDDFSF
jgi:hypothetical protein